MSTTVVGAEGRHQSVQQVARWFNTEHLTGPIKGIADMFVDMADELLAEISHDGPELTAGLRKLLEAKDCMVRAKITELEASR